MMKWLWWNVTKMWLKFLQNWGDSNKNCGRNSNTIYIYIYIYTRTHIYLPDHSVYAQNQWVGGEGQYMAGYYLNGLAVIAVIIVNWVFLFLLLHFSFSFSFSYSYCCFGIRPTECSVWSECMSQNQLELQLFRPNSNCLQFIYLLNHYRTVCLCLIKLWRKFE